MKTTLSLLALLSVGSLFALPACSAEATDDGAVEQSESSEAELGAAAARLVGAHYGLGTGSPSFEGLVFASDGTFFADVDTGIRCITTPCPSSVRLEGRYMASRSWVRLSPNEPSDVTAVTSSLYGWYRYSFATPMSASFKLSRDGGWKQSFVKRRSYCAAPVDCEDQGLPHIFCVGQWTCGATIANQCAFKCGVAAEEVWSPAATRLVAHTDGGGFTPPPPPGSSCGYGAATIALDVATKKIDWQVCGSDVENEPLRMVTGSRILDAAEYAVVEAAAREVKVSTSAICGADKPMLRMTVTTPAGDKTFTDAFYSCTGEGPFVDQIDGLFSALRAAVGPIGG